MKRPPTIEEAQRIITIVSEVEVTYKPEHFSWGPHRAEAYAILDAMGVKFSRRSCFSCWVNTLNKLRTSIGLDPFDHGARPERAAFRIDVCKTCPAYHATTESCGRLIVDALFPQSIIIDGEEIKPCGCYLPLKVTMKHATCPANKWS